mmetsp:Transcript_46350/g.104490  ORF Transcript_46350/g.104490 Transcript_46350/m.104490 type:complete len:231 (-) Transcript_46350:581-1273(-)
MARVSSRPSIACQRSNGTGQHRFVCPSCPSTRIWARSSKAKWSRGPSKWATNSSACQTACRSRCCSSGSTRTRSHISLAARMLASSSVTFRMRTSSPVTCCRLGASSPSSRSESSRPSSPSSSCSSTSRFSPRVTLRSFTCTLSPRSARSSGLRRRSTRRRAHARNGRRCSSRWAVLSRASSRSSRPSAVRLSTQRRSWAASLYAMRGRPSALAKFLRSSRWGAKSELGF